MESALELAPQGQEVEVSAKASRRRFTNEYKRKILREADACHRPGELGALLRREGLYSSHLVKWREARERGELAGAKSKKRGPPAPDPRDKKIVALESELRRATARAERAEGLVDLQKKLAALLGHPLDATGEKH